MKEATISLYQSEPKTRTARGQHSPFKGITEVETPLEQSRQKRGREKESRGTTDEVHISHHLIIKCKQVFKNDCNFSNNVSVFGMSTTATQATTLVAASTTFVSA